MPNMSYCRFQNTVIDLQDCVDTLLSSDFFEQELSPEELRAKRRLLELCKDITDRFGDE